jgi:hypothetical protein
MKTLLLIALSVLLIGTRPLAAQKPIPSYNVPVYHKVNFQEKRAQSPQPNQSRGKRVLAVHKSCTSCLLAGCTATIWVYSLDGRDIMGPFYMDTVDEYLRVDIDEREWGVLVESDNHATVDVWIEEELTLLLPSLERNISIAFEIINSNYPQNDYFQIPITI